MSTLTASLEGHTVIVMNGGSEMIRLNLADLVEYLKEEDKIRIAEIIGWGAVMKQALRRLLGTSEWYAYEDDAKSREEVLAELGMAHADYIARCEASRREAWEAGHRAHKLAEIYTTFFRDALYRANGGTYDGLPENVCRVLQSGHYGVTTGLAESMARVKATCAELGIVVPELQIPPAAMPVSTLAPETAALIDRHRQAWAALREAVLHGDIEGLNNDEINAVLGLIDEHIPEDV